MMENHAYDQIIGNTADAPFINQLASQNKLASAFHGVTHPSLPNYLAAISGDFQGIWDDCQAGATITCAPEEFVPTSGDGTSSTLLTPEQIAAQGGNTSLIHIDWMIGSDKIDIDGLYADGRRVPVFRKGEWA